MLTLAKALKTGKISEFIKQEEKRGVGPVSRKEFDAAVKKLATTPLRSKDQTSRSASRGGSSGK